MMSKDATALELATYVRSAVMEARRSTDAVLNKVCAAHEMPNAHFEKLTRSFRLEANHDPRSTENRHVKTQATSSSRAKDGYHAYLRQECRTSARIGTDAHKVPEKGKKQCSRTVACCMF